jgi:hypothetical protein
MVLNRMGRLGADRFYRPFARGDVIGEFRALFVDSDFVIVEIKKYRAIASK